MSLLGRSVVFGLAFVAAVVAIALGLRRWREAPAPEGRGAWTAVRRAFWSAAAVLLGTSAAGCGTVTCYLGVPSDVDQDSDATEDGEDADDSDDGGPTDAAGEGDVEALEDVDASDDDAADVGDSGADTPADAP